MSSKGNYPTALIHVGICLNKLGDITVPCGIGGLRSFPEKMRSEGLLPPNIMPRWPPGFPPVNTDQHGQEKEANRDKIEGGGQVS